MKSTRTEFLMAGALVAGGLGFVRSASAALDEEAASKLVSQLAEFDIIEGKEQEAVKALQTLCEAVEAAEPGVLAYVCNRSSEDPKHIIFFEIFKDRDAVALHGRQPHLTEFIKGFGTLYQGPVKATRLNRLGGFTR